MCRHGLPCPGLPLYEDEAAADPTTPWAVAAAVTPVTVGTAAVAVAVRITDVLGA
ncbi:hypothetical protein ACFV0C_19495 [Streptomyces sp. NPDC059568]|uniref:hypothetical protein n=1 Tax=Streptomyces sp. NPDC059568 TaxID=3346868 RepID=UPI00367B101B